jgi:hypothetical protein
MSKVRRRKLRADWGRGAGFRRPFGGYDRVGSWLRPLAATGFSRSSCCRNRSARKRSAFASVRDGCSQKRYSYRRASIGSKEAAR